GIVSTTGQTSPAPGGSILALYDNTTGGVTEWPAGSGYTIDSTCLIGKYTLVGDVNLDSHVTTDDYAIVDVFRGITAGATWSQGDVNGDGQITSDDFSTMDVNRGL